MEERIQKIIAASGYCSRRAAEKLITAKRVRVNGNIASLGDSATAEDIIEVDGKPLAKSDARTYIMLNKPRGYVSTMDDERGRKTVADLVADVGVRVFPVGRLDMVSEGLLIMTDDGNLANRLMHPGHEVEKIYTVIVRGDDFNAALEKLRGPLVLDGVPLNPAKVTLKSAEGDRAVLTVTISEGRNRQIRRMCELAGLTVTRLKRISEGNLKLGGLPTGKWRHLLPNEIDNLQKY